MKSYLGSEIKKQLIKNLTSGDSKKAKLAKNTLEKYYYSNKYKQLRDEAYYFIGRKQGVGYYIILRDTEKTVV